MPLSDKELETFLWEHPTTCAVRGLHIDYNFFQFGRRYRRLSLGPYGIAPLVSVRYWPPTCTFYVQVIVFTRAALTTTLYQQAKRYQSALRDALKQAMQAAGITAAIIPSCVLIGQRVQLTGDFVYTLNLDANCQTYTYTYDVNGLIFKQVGKGWYMTGSECNPTLAQLAAELLAQREDALVDDGQADMLGQQGIEALPQDYLAALVVTAEGILVNDIEEGAGEDE